MAAPPALPDHDPSLLDEVCRRMGIRMLLLFGSHATGQPPPAAESDLDLAARLESGRKGTGFWELHEALGEVFPHESLDLVRLHDADPLFRWEILRNGVLLWGDPVEHLEYRAFAYRDFVDSADLRALERKLFEKKMDHVRRRLGAAP